MKSALVSESMARANAYQKRLANAAIWLDRRWEISLGFDPGAEPEFSAPLDEYASWLFEAVTAAMAIATTVPGVGQTYLEATKDRDGNWLDGGKAYRLRVDAHVPGKQFAEQRLLFLRTGRWRLDFLDRRAPACGRLQAAATGSSTAVQMTSGVLPH